MEQGKEYYAFISYKREDERWAKWLQHKLEHYRFPTRLSAGGDFPRNIRPTFRDVTDLTPGLLPEEIDAALRSSQWLIVVCSPRSAKSPWVCKEAQSFIDSGRADHIIPFVIEGVPFSSYPSTECFPKALLGLTGGNELLAANINEMGRDAAAIKVVARMFGLRFDVLWQRHRRARIRRTVLIAALTLTLAVGGAWASLYVARQKLLADKARQERQAQMLFTEYYRCEKLLKEKQFTDLFRASQDILKGRSLPDTLASRFEYFLRTSYDALRTDTLKVTERNVAGFPAMEWGRMPVAFSAEGDIICVGCSGFSVLDASSGESLFLSDNWPDDIRIVGDRIYSYDDYRIITYDRNSFEVLASHDLSMGSGDYQMLIGSSADGRRFLTEDKDGDYNVFDTPSCRLVRSFAKGAYTASINHDGSIVALCEDGRAVLYRTDTGERVPGVPDLPAETLQFDQSGRWLLAFHDGGAALFNPDTGGIRLIGSLDDGWEDGFNFDGNIYGSKYYVSDDDRYAAVGNTIYSLSDGSPFKRLDDPGTAMGLKIYPGAGKVVQVNVERELVVYTRSGASLFETVDDDFSDLYASDKTEQKYDIQTTSDGTVVVKDRRGGLLGRIERVGGGIYWQSISPDGKYILISSPAIPTSLYALTTGTLVQEFPFFAGDGDLGIGVIGEDGFCYFHGLEAIVRYPIIPLDELLAIESAGPF
ncbi:MAG: toll/interleukin-1 receptor domain-containing protein [Bacteroidales bacterium]|nr:toll/interleukin-1 receptor domain-containing protein [Bacteroidales bacterium]